MCVHLLSSGLIEKLIFSWHGKDFWKKVCTLCMKPIPYSHISALSLIYDHFWAISIWVIYCWVSPFALSDIHTHTCHVLLIISPFMWCSSGCHEKCPRKNTYLTMVLIVRMQRKKNSTKEEKFKCLTYTFNSLR